MKTKLKNGESGYLGEQLLMFQRMIETDAHLSSVVHRRRLSLRKAQIMFQPPRGFEADPIAVKAVEYVQLVLSKVIGWPDVILDLVDGEIKGFCAKEIEWADGTPYPIALLDVPDEIWRWGKTTGLEYQSADKDWFQVPPWKFLIHSPRGNSPNPLRRGIMRSVAMLWVMKHYAMADWSSFVEVYGVPPRIVKYPTSLRPDDPALLEAFESLKSMGAVGFATIRDDFNPGDTSTQATRGSWSPHNEFISAMDRGMSKAILTETLSTDTSGSTGTYAAARIHAESSSDLEQATADGIASCIRAGSYDSNRGEKGVLDASGLEQALAYQQQMAQARKQILLGQALQELDLVDTETINQAITMQILQLHMALQQANRQLEDRVKERTVELEKAVDKLKELNQLKANFIASISHELRTPLAHLKGYLDLVYDGSLGSLTPEQLNALSEMVRAETRLESLIEDLIQFGLAARGELKLTAEAVDINKAESAC